MNNVQKLQKVWQEMVQSLTEQHGPSFEGERVNSYLWNTEVWDLIGYSHSDGEVDYYIDNDLHIVEVQKGLPPVFFRGVEQPKVNSEGAPLEPTRERHQDAGSEMRQRLNLYFRLYEARNFCPVEVEHALYYFSFYGENGECKCLNGLSKRNRSGHNARKMAQIRNWALGAGKIAA